MHPLAGSSKTWARPTSCVRERLCSVPGLRPLGMPPQKSKEVSLLSRTLGYCIILGAAGAKAPQILQIMRHNAAGLSLLMPAMEVLAYTACFSYHAAKQHPLSSYGEDYFNCFQAAVVAYQVLAYRGQLAGRSLCLALIGAYGLLVGALVNLRKLLEPKLADTILNVLMSSAMCLSVTARWPQIILNFRNRGVGQMNIVTTLMYCFGNCVRLYTTATQLGWDRLTMAGSTCSALGNFTLALQYLLMFGQGSASL